MSVLLLNAAVDYLRDQFTQQVVPTIQRYAGEFNAAEVGRFSFSCPAVLVAVLGWKPANDDSRLRGRHARQVRLAAFVVTKHVRREDRMDAAAALSDQLCVLLRDWRPDDAALAVDIAPLEDTPSAENLYGAAIDEQGLALWLVDWWQAAQPKPGLPPAALYDLLRVDIEDTTQQGQVPAAAPGPTGLVVTERVDFKTPL